MISHTGFLTLARRRGDRATKPGLIAADSEPVDA
jgi:hypothetical protein